MPDQELWKAPSPNKRTKKKALSGELTQGHTGHRATQQTAPTDGEIKAVQSLVECFENVEDPRVDRTKHHLLIDIMVIAMLAVIANSDKWSDIRIWAETHETWLSTLLELPNGLPSRDTIRRTISRIDPGQFQAAFLDWLRNMRIGLRGVVAIDGKTLRGSKVGGNKPLHIVSAWAAEQHLTLGQQRVDSKSNEITAIPLLLRTLEIAGAIVTIDAMGCQKEIAAQITRAKADYCLAVKGNHETLMRELEECFERAINVDFSGKGQQQLSTVDAKVLHGREESRHYYTMPVPKTMDSKPAWSKLESIGMAITYRSAGSDGEVRYFIMSFAADVQKFAHAVRSHWSIENSLHWVMDVTFGEDACRIRKDHGGENVSWLRRLATSILKNDVTKKCSIRQKRLYAGYDIKYLIQVLNGIPIEN